MEMLRRNRGGESHEDIQRIDFERVARVEKRCSLRIPTSRSELAIVEMKYVRYTHTVLQLHSNPILPPP